MTAYFRLYLYKEIVKKYTPSVTESNPSDSSDTSSSKKAWAEIMMRKREEARDNNIKDK